MNEVSIVYHGVIYSKKNSKRIVTNWRTGRPSIISNKNAKSQEERMAWELCGLARQEGWRCNWDDLDERETVPTFEVEIHIWNKDKRRRDLDNQATAILDGLVAAGVIPDDSVDYLVRLTVQYRGIDREDPRAVIMIRETEWAI